MNTQTILSISDGVSKQLEFKIWYHFYQGCLLNIYIVLLRGNFIDRDRMLSA